MRQYKQNKAKAIESSHVMVNGEGAGGGDPGNGNHGSGTEQLERQSAKLYVDQLMAALRGMLSSLKFELSNGPIISCCFRWFVLRRKQLGGEV